MFIILERGKICILFEYILELIHLYSIGSNNLVHLQKLNFKKISHPYKMHNIFN